MRELYDSDVKRLALYDRVSRGDERRERQVHLLSRPHLKCLGKLAESVVAASHNFHDKVVGTWRRRRRSLAPALTTTAGLTSTSPLRQGAERAQQNQSEYDACGKPTFHDGDLSRFEWIPDGHEYTPTNRH